MAMQILYFIENQKDMLLRYAREHHFPNPTFLWMMA